jgi:hypothetical protein
VVLMSSARKGQKFRIFRGHHLKQNFKVNIQGYTTTLKNARESIKRRESFRKPLSPKSFFR